MKKIITLLCFLAYTFVGHYLSAQPTITSFSPAAGDVGSTVTITGTNFTGTTKVFFGGAPAAGFTVVNSTTITATVPSTAYTGSLAVDAPSGFIISQLDFRVNNPQNSVIQAGGSKYFFKDGTLYGWGNTYLGDGIKADRRCVVEIPLKGSLTGKTISQIAVGSEHTLFLASDGTLHSIGVNAKGQLGTGIGPDLRVPKEITGNGSLNGKTIITISAGGQNSLAIASDGSVHVWGDAKDGQLGNGNIAAGVEPLPIDISNMGSLSGKTFIKASMEDFGTMLLATDGTLHGFGINALGSLGADSSYVQKFPVPTVMSGALNGKIITQVVTAYGGTLALDNTGTVYGWGSGYIFSDLGTYLSRVPVAINVGPGSSLNGKKVVMIARCQIFYSGYALDKDGSVHVWGAGTLYALGNGSAVDIGLPALLPTSASLNGKTVAGLVSSFSSGFVLANDNTFHMWGCNYIPNGVTGCAAYTTQVNFPAKPTVESSGLNFSNITDTSVTIRWTKGNGEKRYVVLKPVVPVDKNLPYDGGGFIADTNFTKGQSVDTTGSMVYEGSDSVVNVTGLTKGTVYHAAIFEFNLSSVCGMAFYKMGNPGRGTFTSAELAKVNTSPVSTVSTTTAVMGGDVTHAGWVAVSERGIVYATSPDPTTANTKIAIGTGTGTFSQTVSGLIPNTTYHIRAYAINSAGINYGADSTFTTLTALASVNTGSPISITVTSAMLGGEVVDDSNSVVTQRGIVYATTPNPTTADSTVQIGIGTGNFSQNITELAPGTAYYVRAYAINGAGTNYGADSSFTTLAALANIVTQLPTAITTTTATLGGEVISDSGAVVTESGIVYSTSLNPTTADNKIQISTGTGIFSQTITGFAPGTVYHVRAYAINSMGTSYGADSAFTTLVAPPAVITSLPAAVTTTSATLGGEVLNDSGAVVTERGIVYSTLPGPTIADTKVQMGTGTGIFSQNISGLSPGITYYVRAYAINSAGTGYGADSAFTTHISLAAVTTASPGAITATSATLGGEVVNDSGAVVTERGVVYALSPAPTITDTKIQIGNGTGTFSQTIPGLLPNTTYYVRAYAVNSVGTSYGTDSAFTTLTSTPFVITASPSAITYNSASLGGIVTNDNGETVTERGIVYSALPNPTTADTKVQMGTGTGAFSQVVSGLASNTIYYIRAYAVNSVGTGYGEDSVLTTLVNGVHNVTTSVKIECYPNPASEELTVKASMPFTKLVLGNSLGQAIIAVQGSEKLYVGGIEKGIYFLQVYNNTELLGTQKVLIQ